MEFPILIKWTSLFPFWGLLGGIFHLYSNLNRTFCKQTVETLIRCYSLQHLSWVCTVHQQEWIKRSALSQQVTTRQQWTDANAWETQDTKNINESRHRISNNVLYATSKGSDQPAHMSRLVWAFASRLNILWRLSYWPNIIGVSKLKRRLHRLVWVYTFQNATLLEITHCPSNDPQKKYRLGTVSKTILLEGLNRFQGTNFTLNSDVDQDT